MKTKEEAIEELEAMKKRMAEIQEFLDKKPEVRPRVSSSKGFYWYTDSVGDVCTEAEGRFSVDDLRYKTGNYELTQDDLKSSQIYNTINSEYFYWFPGCPWAKPKYQPKGLEWFYDVWQEASAFVEEWESCTYRWPKDQS